MTSFMTVCLFECVYVHYHKGKQLVLSTTKSIDIAAQCIDPEVKR